MTGERLPIGKYFTFLLSSHKSTRAEIEVKPAIIKSGRLTKEEKYIVEHEEKLMREHTERVQKQKEEETTRRLAEEKKKLDQELLKHCNPGSAPTT